MTALPKFELLEQTEFRQWLKANRETLKKYDPFEVAHLAITCGFEMADICNVLIDFTDSMAGSSLNNRAKFHVWNTERAIERVKIDQILDLTEQWRELSDHEQGL